MKVDAGGHGIARLLANGTDAQLIDLIRERVLHCRNSDLGPRADATRDQVRVPRTTGSIYGQFLNRFRAQAPS
jgi:hypothetical protein